MRVRQHFHWSYPPRPPTRRRDEAKLRVIYGGDRLEYHATAAAAAKISEWGGKVAVEWEVDDQTLKPVAVHLSRPSDGRGFKLLTPWQKYKVINIPTSAVGRARGRPQVVEETISDGEIVITVPFEFTVAIGEDQSPQSQ